MGFVAPCATVRFGSVVTVALARCSRLCKWRYLRIAVFGATRTKSDSGGGAAQDGTMFAGAKTREWGDITRVPMAQGRSGGNSRAFIQVADLVTFIDTTFTNSESNQAALSTCPTALDATFMESTTAEHTILMRLVDPMAFNAAREATSITQPAAPFNVELK